jgi:branched-chain amino acid transport system ATP-binding protein
LLELENVDSYYGESHILRDVSMSVEEGEVCSLLGRNGAGKTTTLRSISAAHPPDVRDGTIRFKGEDVTDLSTEDVSARGISLVPEERRVFPNLTVAENIRLPEVARNRSNTWGRSVNLSAKGMSTEQVYEEFPRLDERRDQKAGTLSGGEQQMLAIARALLSDPDLLLVDEPTEGLMPSLVDQLRDILVQINDDGVALLLVEQNVELALEISDYGYVIDEGMIQAEAASSELEKDEEIKRRYLAV